MGKIKRGIFDDKGKVFTPPEIARHMVEKLFANRKPDSTSRVLDAGSGLGIFIQSILLWCDEHKVKPPEVVGVEIDHELANLARKKFKNFDNVKIVIADFLQTTEKDLEGKFDYIISNPPYISYEAVSSRKRELYKKIFRTAYGRFDIYFLFFEKAVELLKDNGRLVFITPEKYLYVLSAKKLRVFLSQYYIEEIELVREDAFGDVLAYPAITVLLKTPSETSKVTKITHRDCSVTFINLPRDGAPWIKPFADDELLSQGYVELGDMVSRLSAGVATGRDSIFVIPKTKLIESLKPYAYPTVSGSELSQFKPGEEIDYSKLRYVMLVPYSRSGKLLPEWEIKSLVDYLLKFRNKLESRYAVKVKNKPWYAFHEDPPIAEILKPKIIWPDIAKEPVFFIDAEGELIPRHNVYYLIPKNQRIIYDLANWLNSSWAKKWLVNYCQRAANSYIRLQSHVLKELPVPITIINQKCLESPCEHEK